MDFVDGFAIADVLELTYIRKDLAVQAPSTTLYPQDLDASNDPSRPDYLLWFFPFVPLREEVVDFNFVSSIKSSNKAAIEKEVRELSRKISVQEDEITALRKLREALWS